ncbi:MAG: ribosome biogenesis GTP-binding protein YihA/YsxC [Defluviitaleaceae bacterium]|nr:ribosome biogenesis GTP-binding protein YihA/YsxC [Defluviitaleaceae bacterium]
MFINNVKLEATVVDKAAFPAGDLPEACLCGRSNVGKSSLVNTMVNRKSLARVSQNPGKTRTINFFNVEDRMRLVDLPGYGYAKTSKTESAKWGKMVEGYLKNRDSLRAITLLLDIRHAPNQNDRMMYDFVRHYNYDLIVVATKWDKIPKNKTQTHLNMLRKELALPGHVQVLPFSSHNKQGREELWQTLFDICEVTFDKNIDKNIKENITNE